ncbi:flagellar hook protein FlgE [Terasakiella brassicae]|uniref:Flagellar hook protein FlgE n=1 Tax=Terasakiella brassicae TaxID=1634917 RepID=A0A917F7R0_9PROT|nr:flagellar hook-basal body complex protein [Terasakiella brassicae]GGF56243.1 flagellar hook protein FlgE [Terasakiella brassicae]
MSLYGALFSGVSGLQAQSSAMGAIADNVTNVNTIGYKSTQVNFQTLVTKQASLTKYSAGGVQSKPRQGVDVQGLLQSTTSATDISISGGGFFIVNEAGSPSTGDIYAYSRAGSFRVDKEGYLQNTSGYYLQGWPLQTWDGSTQAVQKDIGGSTYMKSYRNTEGDTVYINDNIVDNTNLRPLNLKTIGGTAVSTTTISMGANLPSSAAVGKSHKTDVLIYDSLGAAHNINHTWTKRASNAWDLSVVPPRGSASIVVEDQNSARNNYMSIGRMDFDSIPDAGKSMTINVDNTDYTINFSGSSDDLALQTRDLAFSGTNPADGETFTMDVGGTPYVFEFDNDSSVTSGNISVSIGSTLNSTISNLNTVLNTQADTVFGQGEWFSVSGGTITFNNPVNAAAPNNAVTFSEASAATLTDGGLTPATLALAADRTLNINTSGRSLSQVMDKVAAAVNNILQTEYAGTPKSPPNNWAERIAGENSVAFHNGSTSYDISVDMSGLTTAGVTSVIQDSAFTVEKLDSAAAWTDPNNYTLEFNGDGTPNKFFGTDEATASDPRIQYKIDWANGAEDMNGSDSPALSVSLGNYNVADGMTQFGDTYQINYIAQNGASFGNFAGVTIGEDGVVTALFDNGVTRPIFMIPVATMVNPNGMNSLSGNVWIETDFSGQPTVREAGSAGSGSVQQSSLEASTVDLGEEFTSMITTQRAYSAAAKIISTSDEMLEELLRVKR